MPKLREVPIVFAKLNVEPSLFADGETAQAIFRRIFEGQIRIIHETVRNGRKSGWVITDTRIWRQDGREYAVGKLGRISPKKMKVFLDAPFEVVEKEEPKAYVDSHFVLSLADERLLFQEVPSRISAEQFCEAFASILSGAEDKKLGLVSVYPLVMAEEYGEVYARLKAINRVRIELVQPNPASIFFERAAQVERVILSEPKAKRAIVDCESGRGLERDSDLLWLAEHLPTRAPEYSSVSVWGSLAEGDPEQVYLSSFEKAQKIRAVLPDETEDIWAKLIALYVHRHLRDRKSE